MPNPEQIAEKFIKHLEESLVEHLKEEMHKMIESAVQKHFEGINKRLDSITRTMDLWKADFDEDRKTLNALILASGYTKADLDSIAKNVNNLPKKMEEKIEQTVNASVAEALPEAVNNSFQVTQQNPKTRVAIIEKPKKKRFWFF